MLSHLLEDFEAFYKINTAIISSRSSSKGATSFNDEIFVKTKPGHRQELSVTPTCLDAQLDWRGQKGFGLKSLLLNLRFDTISSGENLFSEKNVLSKSHKQRILLTAGV